MTVNTSKGRKQKDERLEKKRYEPARIITISFNIKYIRLRAGEISKISGVGLGSENLYCFPGKQYKICQEKKSTKIYKKKLHKNLPKKKKLHKNLQKKKKIQPHLGLSTLQTVRS